MKHQFSQVPNVDIPRSVFDRSSGLKTTFDAGLLIPVFLDEVLPGDTFNLRTSLFGRLATPLFPIMDNAYLDLHFFYVPNRIIWDNFKRFMGEQPNPTSSTDFVIPRRTGLTVSENSLSDYFGLPLGDNISVSDLPYRAYNLIYNDWYRDQNLQSSAALNVGDNITPISSYPIRRRGKRHDYFTSALPFPQKGDSVEIPLLGDAPITGLSVPLFDTPGGSVTGKETNGDNVTYSDSYNTSTQNGLYVKSSGGSQGSAPEIYADLSATSGATINQLRQAFQIQKLLERDARGGTRYVELIKSHFGISNAGGDARMQRPEFLGGGSVPLNVTPIAQTSETATTPQGSLAAMGTLSGNNIGFSRSFTEHGLVMGIASIRADLTYQQGINRMWNRSTRYDFYWPSLAHIGEQEILNREIYYSDNPGDVEVFGYQERYAEYRYKPSQITGQFRSDAAQSLDAWHLSQDFSSLPNLGSAFIQEDPPFDRCIAVPTEPHFIFDFYFKLKCARPMPLYGIPGFIDHF